MGVTHLGTSTSETVSRNDACNRDACGSHTRRFQSSSSSFYDLRQISASNPDPDLLSISPPSSSFAFLLQTRSSVASSAPIQQPSRHLLRIPPSTPPRSSKLLQSPFYLNPPPFKSHHHTSISLSFFFIRLLRIIRSPQSSTPISALISSTIHLIRDCFFFVPSLHAGIASSSTHRLQSCSLSHPPFTAGGSFSCLTGINKSRRRQQVTGNRFSHRPNCADPTQTHDPDPTRNRIRVLSFSPSQEPPSQELNQELNQQLGLNQIEPRFNQRQIRNWGLNQLLTRVDQS